MATLSGGDKLNKALSEIAERLNSAASVDVGFFAGKKYPDGTSIAEVAIYQEFGTSRGIPPRPFFRIAIAKNKGSWPKLVKSALKLSNDNAEKALDLTGQVIQEQVQQSIRDLISPPLKPATIARKGFDKPLIDTGALLSSVTHKVNS